MERDNTFYSNIYAYNVYLYIRLHKHDPDK